MLIRMAALLLLAAPSAFAGSYYRTEMVRPSGTAIIDAWVQDSRARFSVVEGTDRSVPAGFHIISADSGDHLTIEVPNKCLNLTYEQYEAAQKKKLENSGMTPIGVVRVEKLLEEDGQKIAGLPTRHFRMRVAMDFQSDAAIGPKSTIVVVEDLWTVTSMPAQSPRLNMMFKQTTGVAEIDRALLFADIPGFRLKRVVDLTIGDQHAGTSTIEVKEYREEPIAADVFKLPGDCTTIGAPSK